MSDPDTGAGVGGGGGGGEKKNINKVTKCHGTLASLSRSVGNEDVEQL